MSNQDHTLKKASETGEFAVREGHKGYWVIGLLFTLATAAGVLVAYQYDRSERLLIDIQTQMHEAGTHLSAEECLDETLTWFESCEAMSGLCQGSVTRVMGVCLAAQERPQYCASLPDNTAHRSFGYADCQSRDTNDSRQFRRACGAAYQAIHHYCSSANDDSELVTTASSEGRGQ
ncbi:MAG: hypothetical protein KC561_12425 [Myxococcales bacterium]|nr:hypothetical protein [Myxococcales bacterium]